MGISIKHDEYERLIRQLATERGVSLTEAVGMAVRKELGVATAARDREAFMERIRRAQAIFAAATIHDPRTDDEITGYDEYGLPV